MEIEFGNLEQIQPQRGLRPDQDSHFAVATIGDPGEGELKIYVDLDVLRDMEAHAHSNTRVELGGVMLGQQCVDDQGIPFVTISDSLRAHHYEATQGSFKFTHETWSQITRERKTFRPDLEMVGWYHTHPGWSVFLSGMDLFICNHFFNRPLDVALVIDPCNDDRGWFQWLTSTDAAARPTTARTGGFLLTTNRFRNLELEHFARAYNKEPAMNQDPRYNGNMYGGNQPMVNLTDNRKPIFEIMMMSMLLMQFLLFAVIGWKVIAPGAATAANDDHEPIALLQQKLDDLESSGLQQARQQAYHEVLQSIVSDQTGDHNLVEEFAALKTEQQQLQSNITAQMALAEKISLERDLASRELKTQTEIADDLGRQLVTIREKLTESNARVTDLSAQLNDDPAKPGAVSGMVSLRWWWLASGGIVLVGIAGVLGFFLARIYNPSNEFFEDRREHDSFDQAFGELAQQQKQQQQKTTATSKTTT